MVGRAYELISELYAIINSDKIARMILDIVSARRIYLCGNGGSASNAQHFESDLQSLNIDAICLNNNAARITALTNDYGWEDIYIKQLQHMTDKDILMIFTVHGSTGQMHGDKWSQNLAKAAQFAREHGARVLLFSGCNGGTIIKFADSALTCISGDVDVVEPFHAAACHEICAQIKDTIN